MTFNKLKTYSQLLDLAYLNPTERTISLKGVFKRDIENNIGFHFRKKLIRPIQKEGQVDMDNLFHHLTTKDEKDEKGKKTGARSFEMARSQRLHWVKYHIDECKKENIAVFSYEDRVEGRDKIRTYIYDVEEEYVIILEPQRSAADYYLITAYHLNEPGGKKQIEKKQKKKLDAIY